MGVDAYVMPLWKFHTGDFDSPLEASGLVPKVTYVSPGGIFERRRWTGAWARWRAKRAVRRMAREVSEVNGGGRIVWNDEGPVVYSQQFRVDHYIKSYLWWYDRRDVLGDFSLPKEGDESARPFWSTEPQRMPSFPHLLGNGYYNDYFLPVEFEHVADVERYVIAGFLPASKKVGSTPRARRELQVIDQELRIPQEYVWDESDPLSGVRGAFHQLHEILDLSHRHGLPVIFWG